MRRNRDGLTPETMEVGWVARMYLRHFMNQASVMKPDFRTAGVDRVAEQVRQGAGWLVVTSPDESTPALIEAGRRFVRMALQLRERRLAAHPMSQVLEEQPWRGQIARELGLSVSPQFVLRVGSVTGYPAPRIPRRAPTAFVRFG